MDFFVRLTSSIVILLALALLALFGGLPLLCSLAVISVIAFIELTNTFGVTRTKEQKALAKNKHKHFYRRVNGLQISGIVAIVTYYIVLGFLYLFFPNNDEYISVIIAAGSVVLALWLLMILYVFTFPKYSVTDVAKSLFSFCYGPLSLSFIYLLRSLDFGNEVVWLIFCASWACDTAAYAMGFLLGKHKLAPVLSPKKTIEGAVFGVLGAFIAGLYLGFYMIMNDTAKAGDFQLWIFAGIAATGAVLSQIGDLAASAIKRTYHIKDYGNLIPGHGGIMDRFDSVAFVAPFVYFFYLGTVHL